jgi:pimeloyl-ACP methyl ester carboxylesterase
MTVAVEREEVELHGHLVGYQIAGEGPVVGLIHGITSTSESWRRVMPRLAERYTVVAPDLLGHGGSAKPQGDYSLGAYASGIRDLMGVLGADSGSVVGHSLGGGIALQFAYQFPEYCERLVLISSGGLGREVHPLLRAASLPGSELVLPLLARDWSVRAGEALAAALGRLGLRAGSDLGEFARGYASLADPAARAAFLRTVRALIGPSGQQVSALDRLYLAEDMPTLIVWGTDDPIIPVEHGRAAHELIPGSELVEIEGAGHWPQLDEPDRLVEAIGEFIEETVPYRFDLERMREQLQQGPPEAVAAA